MSGPSEKPEREQLEEARQLQQWVRHYAQNRSLPVIVALAASALLFVAIAAPSYWGGVAYRAGNIPVFVACLGVAIFATAATIFVAVPRWGGQRLQRIAAAMYAREGNVTISAPRANRPWLITTIAVAFAACVLGTVMLGVLDYLPDGKYMQPISALYAVPFLVALNFLMRPTTGYVPLMWPLLYALHAALIVAGAPIVFAGVWEPLNMILPIVGYGMLTSLVGHFYSRWALHKARSIVSRQFDRADLVEDGEQ